MRKSIENNTIFNHYKYNPYKQEIEKHLRHDTLPLVNIAPRGSLRRSLRRSRRYAQILQPVVQKYHPSTRRQHMISQMKLRQDDLVKRREASQKAGIGEYVSLDITPAIIYITIRKGAQLNALKLVAKRVFTHCKGTPTSILVKGKGKYTRWLTPEVIAMLSQDDILERLINKTAVGKKTIKIMIRQKKSIGKIHELWETKHTLL